MLAEEYEFDKILIHLVYAEKIRLAEKAAGSGKTALAS
jgi:hypothetical protein